MEVPGCISEYGAVLTEFAAANISSPNLCAMLCPDHGADPSKPVATLVARTGFCRLGAIAWTVPG
jgi:hypothetical protein